MPLLIVILHIILLLLLIIKLRVHAFLALIIASFSLGICYGMPPAAIIESINTGIGQMLGKLALLIVLGAVFGALVAESGAANRIADTLISKLGTSRIQLAIIIIGFIVGLPLLGSVALILLIPIAFTIAEKMRTSLLYIGVPLKASLSSTHIYLPPHPAPVALAVIYSANIGVTLLYGLLLAIPSMLIAGLLYGRFFKNGQYRQPGYQVPPAKNSLTSAPAFSKSVLVALAPVLLIAFGAATKPLLPEQSTVLAITSFISEPTVALLLAVFIAIYSLGILKQQSFKDTLNGAVESSKGIFIILLVIGASGGFKQVLVDSGIANHVAELFKNIAISPILLAWLIAAAIRIALGASTVASLTASGIILPFANETNVSRELLVLATTSGSLICSHVNDPGFWMFKEYFGLSIKETLGSWTVVSTIISVVGLLGCLIFHHIL